MGSSEYEIEVIKKAGPIQDRLFLLIKNKSEIDEPKIATQGKYAYRYARDILNGSWKEKIGGELAIKAEKSIANDPAYSRKYSHLFH